MLNDYNELTVHFKFEPNDLEISKELEKMLSNIDIKEEFFRWAKYRSYDDVINEFKEIKIDKKNG